MYYSATDEDLPTGIKPCPGCGSLAIEYIECDTEDNLGYYSCLQCPWELRPVSEGIALSIWNTRTDGEYDYQAGQSALETELLLLIDNYHLPLEIGSDSEIDDVVCLLCTTILELSEQLTAYRDMPASEVPQSLHWLLNNLKEGEQTRIYERIKDNLYSLVYGNNGENS